MPNFSSLSGLEVVEKFVVVGWVNKGLKRVCNPLYGSSHILKRLNPEDKYYAVCDLNMGYYQLELHPESRDLFTIVLPRGKDRYA